MLNRILAIDYGDKKVGLALSDPMKIIAKNLIMLKFGKIINGV